MGRRGTIQNLLYWETYASHEKESVKDYSVIFREYTYTSDEFQPIMYAFPRPQKKSNCEKIWIHCDVSGKL